MTEKQMLAGLRAGDECALDAAMQAYARLLWSIVRAVLHNVGTAEDMEECVADAFIQLWQKSAFVSEQRGGVKAWLCAAAKSRAIDRYRGAARKNEVALDERLSACGEAICDRTLDAVLQRELLAGIDALGEPDREIILRRFYYRQKPKEIALALGMPLRQVENRIFRAKERLKSQWKGETECLP